jgi:hypothetical protein
VDTVGRTCCCCITDRTVRFLARPLRDKEQHNRQTAIQKKAEWNTLVEAFRTEATAWYKIPDTNRGFEFSRHDRLIHLLDLDSMIKCVALIVRHLQLMTDACDYRAANDMERYSECREEARKILLFQIRPMFDYRN